MATQALDRRQMFGLTAKGAVLALAVSSTATLEGCNAQQWLSLALADLPTILQVVTSIISIVGATQGSVQGPLLAEVNKYGAEAQNDLKNAQTLLAQYQTASSSAKPGILSKIDVALTVTQNNLSTILTDFHVVDQTLESTVAAALGAAITMVVAIQALIPPPPAAQTARMAIQNNKDQSAAMKQAYNLIVGKNYPKAAI